MSRISALLGAVGIVAIGASVAVAADLPVREAYRAPALVPVPIQTWTGCYLGAGAGYGMWNQENRAYDNSGVAVDTTTHGGRGWFGTVQVGCDYQMGPTFLIGAFGDYDVGNLKGRVALDDWGGEEKLSSSWAVGGRLGYLVTPQFLTYFAGGYTRAHFRQVTLDAICCAAGTLGFVPAANYSGWFLASGYEYKLTFLPIPGLYWKTEYRFSDYGDRNNSVFDLSGACATPGNGCVTINSRKFVQAIRSEVVWRFSGP